MTDAANEPILNQIEKFLINSELVYNKSGNIFVVTIPGSHKLSTTCSLSVGTTALTVNAFVARNPDENHEAVYRWILERNLKMYGVCFAITVMVTYIWPGESRLHPSTKPNWID